jgi:DNA-directed RNA polymerase subunit RPC12/RpoP
MSRPFDVAARDPGESANAACAHCGQEVPETSLDRWYWCKPCRTELERKARRGQYLVAALTTLPFLVWILVEGTKSVLPTYAWALPLLAAWYLGSRIGRVLIRNFLRSQRGD